MPATSRYVHVRDDGSVSEFDDFTDAIASSVNDFASTVASADPSSDVFKARGPTHDVRNGVAARVRHIYISLN